MQPTKQSIVYWQPDSTFKKSLTKRTRFSKQKNCPQVLQFHAPYCRHDHTRKRRTILPSQLLYKNIVGDSPQAKTTRRDQYNGNSHADQQARLGAAHTAARHSAHLGTWDRFTLYDHSRWTAASFPCLPGKDFTKTRTSICRALIPICSPTMHMMTAAIVRTNDDFIPFGKRFFTEGAVLSVKRRFSIYGNGSNK